MQTATPGAAQLGPAALRRRPAPARARRLSRRPPRPPRWPPCASSRLGARYWRRRRRVPRIVATVARSTPARPRRGAAARPRCSARPRRPQRPRPGPPASRYAAWARCSLPERLASRVLPPACRQTHILPARPYAVTQAPSCLPWQIHASLLGCWPAMDSTARVHANCNILRMRPTQCR
jgi:hypothetical protein